MHSTTLASLALLASAAAQNSTVTLLLMDYDPQGVVASVVGSVRSLSPSRTLLCLSMPSTDSTRMPRRRLTISNVPLELIQPIAACRRMTLLWSKARPRPKSSWWIRMHKRSFLSSSFIADHHSLQGHRRIRLPALGIQVGRLHPVRGRPIRLRRRSGHLRHDRRRTGLRFPSHHRDGQRCLACQYGCHAHHAQRDSHRDTYHHRQFNFFI
ncbi:hypothetical protein VTN77DRAFT_4940 [Rasamsonia byssochlamydoides]|uniref:uncharacterized protein n=1 Tax=Rasamsonia byssochlamydoides TaxID=89139 RepID=UPI00374496D5